MTVQLRRRNRSIAGRLIAFSLTFVAGTILAAAVILWFIVAGVVREQVDQRLDTQIEGLRSALKADRRGAVALDAELSGPPFDRPGSGWYWQVTGKDVRLSSRSMDGWTFNIKRKPADWRGFASGRPRPDDAQDPQGRPLYVRTLSIAMGDQPLQISVSAPQSALNEPAFHSLLFLVPAMAVLGLTLLGGTYLQVRFGLKPLDRLVADIGAVLSGTRNTLSQTEVEELRPVVSEVNRLIDLNERRLEDTRIQFANMAHGLKTPVASLTLGLDETNDPDGSLRALVTRIDRRIRHHLADARKATVAGAMVQATPLRPRLEDLGLVLAHVHRDRDVGLSIDVDARLTVRCDEEDVDEIFGNLLDNAFKWATSGVHLSAARQGSFVEILIRDDGPGMPDERIAEAFQPGLRLDESVAGSGFGLGIAREVAELYGGGVLLRNVDLGFEAVVTLPLMASNTKAGI